MKNCDEMVMTGAGGMYRSRRIRVVTGVVTGLLLSASVAFGQSGDGAAGKVIQRVTISGNHRVSADTIMQQIQSRAGAPLNEHLVSDDARKIISMSQITDVTWRATVDGDGVDLEFVVVESSQIAEVMFVGNKGLKTKDLSKKLQFKTGDFLDPYLIQSGREELLSLYHEKGYYYAEISIDEKMLRDELKVVYVIVEGPKARIKKLTFEGNDSIKAGKLKGKIKSGAYFPIFQKGAVDDEKLEQDDLSLMEYYHNEGYLDARVFHHVRFNEKKTRAFVTFVVEEGPQYEVVGIRFEGNEAFGHEQLIEAVNLETGKVFTFKRQTFAKRSIERFYGQRGYIYSRVKLEPEYTDKPGEVVAKFQLKENDPYHLGKVIIQGNTNTQDKVVRRTFDYYKFTPGAIYDTSAQKQAEDHLKGSGFFETVSVLPIGSDPNMRDAMVDVAEAQTGLILFGVGVDTNSGVLGNFSFEQRNFDWQAHPKSFRELFTGKSYVGGGQRLRLDFMPGTRVTRGQIKFHEPYLFDQPYYFDWNLFLFRRWRESYLERRLGGTTSLGHRFENRWSVEASLRAEQIRVTDLDWGYIDRYNHALGIMVVSPQDVQDVEGSNFLTSIGVGVSCDKTDNMFRPTTGYRINAGWEQVGAAGGDFSFSSLKAGVTGFKTVYEDITERKTVLAGQVEGYQILMGDAPVFERFYAGGIGSLRGFDYRGVSPRDGRNDDPIGSDSMVLASTELTHPLFEETLYGKIFCDTGVVEEGPYRVTVGFGIELVVPQLFQMIPMHFDFGFPIISDDLDDEEVFSFSFGMTF